MRRNIGKYFNFAMRIDVRNIATPSSQEALSSVRWRRMVFTIGIVANYIVPTTARMF